MSEKLKILSLHRMGPPWLYRNAVEELEFMMSSLGSTHFHITHDGSLAFPSYLKDITWDAIIIGSTFLCKRNHPGEFQQCLEEYSWIVDNSAVKIALPQDDYECSEVLDQWMMDWNVDLVMSVLPEHVDVIYPKYSQKGMIETAFTGYVTDSLINKTSAFGFHEDRLIDVSYRASALPANFGRMGLLKQEIGDRFLAAVDNRDLSCDISVKTKDMIPGKYWYDFLRNSKFCLTTPSGSSLLDKRGEYRDLVSNLIKFSPDISFYEIEKQFEPADCAYRFEAISPRNLEAALLGTVQIATPGSYSNVFHEMEHFVPLEEDCSNIEDVLETIKDATAMRRLQKNARESVLSREDLRLSNLVKRLLEFIENRRSQNHVSRDQEKRMEDIVNRYNQEIRVRSFLHWKPREIKAKALSLFR